ncbi:TPR domain protein [Xylariales sp. AK1849]|nr:TPR domain protein [Xylariales sp. AK1849]
MDIQDVSNVDQFSTFLQKVKANAVEASRRKGQSPRDHPPVQILVSRFLMKRSMRTTRQSGGAEINISTSQVPPPYPPSVCSVDELKLLMISRMTLENHHRGNKVIIRILTPPDRMTAVMAIVQDEEGTGVLLQLYNQPEATVVDEHDILRPQSVCIIKEPFFKATTDGSYSLRVDHVSDIVWLLDTDDRIPPKWRKPVSNVGGDAQEIRMQGNAAILKKNWAEAERLYSAAIQAAKSLEQDQLARSNRSLANLRLGRLEKALEDASRSSRNGKPSEKALFREAKALYGLGTFSLCLEKLEFLVRSFPENQEAWSEIKRVKERILEKKTGAYRFSEMYKQAKATPPNIDCATYDGSVTIGVSTRCGRGLFTTKPVKAGELILCEKAFAYSYAGDDDPTSRSNKTILMNTSTNKMTIGGQANLVTQIVQKLYHNHEGSGVFTDLHHGDYDAITVGKVDGQPVVDTFLAERIMSLNCFGAPRTSRKEDSEKKAAYTTCGIWPLSSYINHSCMSNCRRSFIGDMLVARATKDLAAGTELRWCYQVPSAHTSYEESQKRLSSWGFTCDCELCLDRKSTPQKTIQRRKGLVKDLNEAMRNLEAGTQIPKAQRLLGQLEKTYPTRDGVLQLELWDSYFELGQALAKQSKLSEAIEMTIKGFRALGYIIVAYLLGDDSRRSPRLEITRWGQVNQETMEAFLQLFKVYLKVAPELCSVAKRYAETAYSICFGEAETFSTVDAELM